MDGAEGLNQFFTAPSVHHSVSQSRRSEGERDLSRRSRIRRSRIRRSRIRRSRLRDAFGIERCERAGAGEGMNFVFLLLLYKFTTHRASKEDCED